MLNIEYIYLLCKIMYNIVNYCCEKRIIMEIKGAYISISQLLNTNEEVKPDNTNTYLTLKENRTLKIPDYQREYRWKEKQLTDLYKDLFDQNGYIGQIALINDDSNNDTYYIVDGQQRITSIIILITVLCKCLRDLKDDDHFDEFDLHLEHDGSKKLRFAANSFEDIQSLLSFLYTQDINALEYNDVKVRKDAYIQKERFLNAYKLFFSLVIDDCDRIQDEPDKCEWIIKFLNTIFETKVSIILFENAKNIDGERVFLDVNEKGLKLDDEDILKGYYFKRTSEGNNQNILEAWQNLKTNYFLFDESLNINLNFDLSFFANYFLEICLTTDYSKYSPEKFNDSLRYKDKQVEKHICELFNGTNLHKKMLNLCDFMGDMYKISNDAEESAFFKSLDDKSINRKVIKNLSNTIIQANMKIILIALIKFWIVRNNNEEKLVLDDFIQIFAFYVIFCFSATRKDRTIFTKEFFHAKNYDELLESIKKIEYDLLDNVESASRVLKNDLYKAEYLSLSIQKFYNEFQFDKKENKWKIKNKKRFVTLYNQNDLDKCKDHFVVQNGESINIVDGTDIKITAKLNRLKKRVYNFVYHVDSFKNDDFVTRLYNIRNDTSGKKYGDYELGYFNYLENEIFAFYCETISAEGSWDRLLEKHKNTTEERFEELAEKVLDEDIITWHKQVCKHSKTLM